ncbi:MAG: COX15/CtaA family protein [Pseudomonadota bacterium]
MSSVKTLRTLALTAFVFAFVVVAIGAYTRLTDAGLGCPDWPTCYNHLTVPESKAAINQAEKAYPNSPVHVIKAWTEMTHRYVASILGLLIFVLAIVAIRSRYKTKISLWLPLTLIILVVFQALLGKWTVTMKLLPLVVMGHLLGGFTLLSLLWLLYMRASEYMGAKPLNLSYLKPWATIALIIIAIQIALGGWTSANYAALVCPNFPYCISHEFFPAFAFTQAFNVFGHNAITDHYAVQVTIQMTHRIGALITATYLGLLAIALLLKKYNPGLRKIGLVMLIFLSLQVLLGIMNVILLLPLSIALLHNLVAAILLLSVVTLNYYIRAADY